MLGAVAHFHGVKLACKSGLIILLLYDGTPIATTGWLLVSQNIRSSTMDREHVKGTADKAKGTIKEGAGKISGDKELVHEGKTDKAKGDLHEAAGNIKDAARKAADSLKKQRTA
jgi:uncharacterized protein YjbJ (UPF0337 family)